jgi:hypothetical protein
MADEEPAIEHLEHYRNCGDYSPFFPPSVITVPGGGTRAISLAPPAPTVGAQKGRTDCAPAATPWSCAAPDPGRPSCLAVYRARRPPFCVSSALYSNVCTVSVQVWARPCRRHSTS